ncbi:unnamed protein product, partial [Brachionus calyciflorus]
TWQSWPPKSL